MRLIHGVEPTARLEVLDASGAEVVTSGGINRIVVFGQSRVIPSLSAAFPIGMGHIISVASGSYSLSAALNDRGQVFAWGDNAWGLTAPPQEARRGVVSMAAGDSHMVAVKGDGSVVSWGTAFGGITNVPSGLKDVLEVAAGGVHSLALRSDGTVVGWGSSYYGQAQSPRGVKGVVSIAAGGWRSMALKDDGTVLTWGDHDPGFGNAPKGLKQVTAIAAGRLHFVALKHDGKVVVWGSYAFNQPAVPPRDLDDVVAIDAKGEVSLAIKRDGSLVAWGTNHSDRQVAVPIGVDGVVTATAGPWQSLAVIEPRGVFGVVPEGKRRIHSIWLGNKGAGTLGMLRAIIEGKDADQFEFVGEFPEPGIAAGDKRLCTVAFVPKRPGAAEAVLKVYSGDPASPFSLPLKGFGTFDILATRSDASGGSFSYGALRQESATGLMVQKVSFRNTSGIDLHGLRLAVSNLAQGVVLYSSSRGKLAGIFEVLYTRPIAKGELVDFDLVYFDPKRRNAASIQPTIKAVMLEEPYPARGPMQQGREVPGLRVTLRSNGPMLEWRAVPRAIYVVEYSDTNGQVWFSAEHRLTTKGTRLFWVDRGQPETQSRPIGMPNQMGGRMYRVRRL